MKFLWIFAFNMNQLRSFSFLMQIEISQAVCITTIHKSIDGVSSDTLHFLWNGFNVIVSDITTFSTELLLHRRIDRSPGISGISADILACSLGYLFCLRYQCNLTKARIYSVFGVYYTHGRSSKATLLDSFA